MTIYNDRLEEAMWIFFQLFQVDPKFKIYDIPVAEILPLLQKDLVRMIKENEEQAQAVIRWISDSYYYIIGDTDSLPPVKHRHEV